jgi:hypothetical protein
MRTPLEQWEHTQAELEIRRWLVAHNLWAPEAERPVAAEETPLVAQPAAVLAPLLLEWPKLRQQLEAQLLAHAQANPHYYAYHNEQTIAAFELALRQVAALAVQLAPAPPNAPSRAS